MKIWRTVPSNPERARQLAQELQLPLPLAAVLDGRGFKAGEAVQRFLRPRLSDLTDPFLLPQMDLAVRRIWQALDRRETIAVYGDYDVDGLTSTGLLIKILRQLGAARVVSCLPSRFTEGYGLSVEALTRCVELEHPTLVISVDCGSNAVEAAQWAADRKIDLVVTDHHELLGARPALRALVNPKLGSHADLKMLAGVGVVFKLCHALVKQGKAEDRPAAKSIDLKAYLDWVTVGTVADIVPLLGENRILVRHGLAQLNQTAFTGWQALIEVAGLKSAVDTYHIGFMLGPRLNVAGRLGSADVALELLLTEHAERAREIAVSLDTANRERQAIEARILQEAQAEIDAGFDETAHFGLVVGRAGWHPGVVGIVASRLAACYRRPVVVVAFDEAGVGRGSGRSIEGYHLLQGLEACQSHLIRFGGHEMAAGLEIEQDCLEAFRTHFNIAAAAALRGRDLRPVQLVNAWITLPEADEALCEALQLLRPFGQENAEPVLAARGVRIVQPRKVGRNHLRCTLSAGNSQRPAIAFGMSEYPIPDGPVDVAFRLQKNTYRDTTTIQCNIQDIRPAE